MKTLLRLCLLCFCFTSAGLLQAEDKPSNKGGESADLDDSMEAMQGAFRKLRRQVADPAQNEASLALVVKLRKACVEAAKAVPTKVSRMPAAEQPAAKHAFDEKMQELIATVDDLAAALKAGKNEVAVKVIEELRLQEEAGHNKFRTKKQGD